MNRTLKYFKSQSQIQALIFHTWFKYRTLDLSCISSADVRTFLKAGVRKETRKRKPRVNPILTDTAVKAALESEVKEHWKSAKRSRLSRSSQLKSRKSKR
jgi:hypothetical protein